MVVVGAGLFGLAAARSLFHRGHKVVVIDPGPLPFDDAASTDVSKAVRMDYGADLFWVELAERAMEGWHALEVDLGASLYHTDGFVLLTSRPMRPGEFEHDSFETLSARGLPLERLDSTEIQRRFPAFAPGVYVDGYLNPRAGWVESGRAIELLVQSLRRDGVEFLLGQACIEVIEEAGRPAAARRAGGELVRGDELLLAAGAWTPKLAPWLGRRLRAVAQPVLHLRAQDEAAVPPAGRLVWAADIARHGWYGFPALSDGRLKIGHHGRGLALDPGGSREVPPETEARMRAFLAQSLPALARVPRVGGRLCFYCDTQDGDFWIDRDPDHPGLVVAAGGSGHAFKFLPVIGDVIADVIEGRTSPQTRRFAGREPDPNRREAARSLEG